MPIRTLPPPSIVWPALCVIEFPVVPISLLLVESLRRSVPVPVISAAPCRVSSVSPAVPFRLISPLLLIDPEVIVMSNELLKFRVSPPETPPETPSESMVTLAFRLVVELPTPPLSIRTPNVSLASLLGKVAVVGAALNDQLPPSFQSPVVPLAQVAVIAAPHAAVPLPMTAAMMAGLDPEFGPVFMRPPGCC